MNSLIIKNILTNSNPFFEIDDKPLNDLIDEHSLWGKISFSHQKVNKIKKQNLVSNMVFQKEFEELCHLFKKNELPAPIPLKGLSLLKRIYSDRSERKMTDVDLYLPQEFREMANHLLTNNGYSIDSEIKWQANWHKCIYEKNTPLLNINFEFHFQLYYHTNHSPKTLEDSGVLLLSLEEELIYLCYHLAEQHNFTKLFWLSDIKRYIDDYQAKIDWKAAHDLAVKIGVERSFNTCLFIYSHHFLSPPPIPPCVPQRIKKILTWDFLCYPRKSKFKYHGLKLYLKKNRAISYYLGWLRQRLQAKPLF